MKGPDGEDVKPFHAIPGPRGWPMIGTGLELYRKGYQGNFYRWMQDRVSTYGPIMKESIFGTETVLISGVDIIETLAKKDGKYPSLFPIDVWTDYRKRHNEHLGILTR